MSKEDSLIIYNNYIYFNICLLTLKLYNNGNHCSTHASFCQVIKNAIRVGPDKHEAGIILYITKELELIYGLNNVESVDYILNYFYDNLFLKYEKAAKLENYFKSSIMS